MQVITKFLRYSQINLVFTAAGAKQSFQIHFGLANELWFFSMYKQPLPVPIFSGTIRNVLNARKCPCPETKLQ